MLVHFINTIESLAKSRHLRKGEIKPFTNEVIKAAATALECERVNAWMFNEDETELRSMSSFQSDTGVFTQEQSLQKKALPKYFKFLVRNKIIVSDRATQEPMNSELVDNYLVPNKISSMIDVPIRSEGRMIGVICFEHVGEEHPWKIEEQKFCQSIAQLLSLALESNHKKIYQERLETLLKQKELLLAEVNHRVKNNMAVIMSLLNLQKSKVNDEFHGDLFEEIKDKVYTMSSLQEQLLASENINSIDLGEYLNSLIRNLNASYGRQKKISILTAFESIELDVTRAIPCGLIANEILTNSFKYAFGKDNLQPRLEVKVKRVAKKIEIYFHDNGPGFGLERNELGMGLDLIQDLAKQIGGEAKFHNHKGATIQLLF